MFNFGSQFGQAFQTPAIDLADTSEKIYISALPLLKMLKVNFLIISLNSQKHCRAGIPLEVLGLLLGEIVDAYTIRVVDTFEMPQSGTSVSVESVDPGFQQQMSDLLKQTERIEHVVGWYHSHPGFGCWLSNVDINTQFSFEQLNKRAVAVVLDPIQSVKGKIVIDAFRTIDPQLTAFGNEVRQHSSNLGLLAPGKASSYLLFSRV